MSNAFNQPGTNQSTSLNVQNASTSSSVGNKPNQIFQRYPVNFNNISQRV